MTKHFLSTFSATVAITFVCTLGFSAWNQELRNPASNNPGDVGVHSTTTNSTLVNPTSMYTTDDIERIYASTIQYEARLTPLLKQHEAYLSALTSQMYSQRNGYFDIQLRSKIYAEQNLIDNARAQRSSTIINSLLQINMIHASIQVGLSDSAVMRINAIKKNLYALNFGDVSSLTGLPDLTPEQLSMIPNTNPLVDTTKPVAQTVSTQPEMQGPKLPQVQGPQLPVQEAVDTTTSTTTATTAEQTVIF